VNYGDSCLRGRDYEKHRLFFLNQPTEVVKQTFNATTQYYDTIAASARIPYSTQTAHPAANIPRRHEAVATDTLFCNVPAFGSGHKCAQIFVGRVSFHTSAYSCKSDGDFVSCLSDEIRRYGAMDKLISDLAQAEISNQVLDMLRTFQIDGWQSEPHNNIKIMLNVLSKRSRSSPIGSSIGQAHRREHGSLYLSVWYTS